MKLNRKIVLFLALAVVVGLAVFAPPPGDPVGPTKASTAARNTKSADAPAPSRVATKKDSDAGSRPVLNEYPERGILGKQGADLFGTQSWLPPPAPPPKVVIGPPPPPPVPQPPEMTFRFVGRFIQDGKFQVFVSKGDTPVAVRVGDNLDGYVVESISTSAIALVYPPLGHKMNIAIPPAFAVDNAAPAPAFGALPGPTQAQVQPPAPQPGAFPLPGMQPQPQPQSKPQAKPTQPVPAPVTPPKPAVNSTRVK
jgi:hypothetical protein